MYTTIKTLWDLGKNKSEIARVTGHDWKTVAKVIKGIKNGIDKPKYKDGDGKRDHCLAEAQKQQGS